MRRAPGTLLLAAARHLLDPSCVDRVLEPLVADWQREWSTADSHMRRAFVRVRGCAAFISSAMYCCATEKMPGDVRRRAWTTWSAFVGLGLLASFAMSIPLLVRFPGYSVRLLYLIPSNLVLSISLATLPLGMLLGTIGDHAGGRRHLFRFTIVAAALVFVLHNWITPNANQAFREHVVYRAAEQAGKVAAYRTPQRGLREMTLGDLVLVRSSRSSMASRAAIAEELHRRTAVPLVPVLLASLGWHLARVSNAAGARRLAGWWIFVSVTYGFAVSLGMTFERSWGLPRSAAVWLPLVLWTGAIAVLMRAGMNAGPYEEDSKRS